MYCRIETREEKSNLLFSKTRETKKNTEVFLIGVLNSCGRVLFNWCNITCILIHLTHTHTWLTHTYECRIQLPQKLQQRKLNLVWRIKVIKGIVLLTSLLTSASRYVYICQHRYIQRYAQCCYIHMKIYAYEHEI